MKKISVLFLSGLFILAGHGLALAEHDAASMSGGMVKVHQCPMDKYTMPVNCPVCGMKMEEKEMTTAEANEAIEKSSKMDTGTKPVVSLTKQS
jgi:hypothetical protein